ncbi:MAG: 3-phosphoshikimate 1-carboxyvinyltransferase, partial [Calditrichia bacterium]|nr:3-phosphoshikimate 1-carboxyvinyltransferase [Calditrichia bacterium]
MNTTVKPFKIDGIINAPASKSEMQRVVAAALLSNGTTHITNHSFCDDAKAALNIAESLGAKVDVDAETVKIRGGLNPVKTNLNCGEAGLSIRMFSPIAALCNQEIILSGEGSLKKRPVGQIEQPLESLGAACSTTNGYLPVKVKGPIKGGNITIDGSISSQFLTGLLIALPYAQKDSQITVKNLKSRPYIDLTISVLRQFGITINHSEYKVFNMPGNQKFKAIDYNIEGDWSGAAFLLAAGAINGTITVSNLNYSSTQADKKIIEVLKKANIYNFLEENSVTVSKNKLENFNFDASDCPDLFPPLAVLAANCRGISKISGVNRLKHKESNRAAAL